MTIPSNSSKGSVFSNSSGSNSKNKINNHAIGEPAVRSPIPPPNPDLLESLKTSMSGSGSNFTSNSFGGAAAVVPNMPPTLPNMDHEMNMAVASMPSIGADSCVHEKFSANIRESWNEEILAETNASSGLDMMKSFFSRISSFAGADRNSNANAPPRASSGGGGGGAQKAVSLARKLRKSMTASVAKEQTFMQNTFGAKAMDFQIR